MVTGMAVMRGAYNEQPYAVNVLVMDDRGALLSPGGWRAANPARLAIRLLLLLLFLRRRYSVFNTLVRKRRFQMLWFLVRIGRNLPSSAPLLKLDS